MKNVVVVKIKPNSDSNKTYNKLRGNPRWNTSKESFDNFWRFKKFGRY